MIQVSGSLIFESFHITPHSAPLARLEQTSCLVKSGVEEGKGDVMPCFREREASSILFA